MRSGRIRVFAFAAIFAMAFQIVGASGNGWNYTSIYPQNVTGQQCFIYSGYLYCIGGASFTLYSNSTYSAPVLNQGIGAWQAQESYPVSLAEESCVNYSNNVYCIGGFNQTSYITTTYAATLSDGSISNWRTLEPYPLSVSGLECSASGTQILCVGGTTAALKEVNQSYFTSVSGNVLIASASNKSTVFWANTSAYPIGISGTDCQGSNGYVYCIGGESESGYVNSTFFTKVNASGASGWISTTPYPAADADISCATYSGYIVCVGGYNVTSYTNRSYAAQISGSGIGKWTRLTDYPAAESGAGCAVSPSGDMYCTGGYNSESYINVTYYADIAFATGKQTITAVIVSQNSTNLGTTIASTTVSGTSSSAASQNLLPSYLEYAIIVVIIAIVLIYIFMSRARPKPGSSKKPGKP